MCLIGKPRYFPRDGVDWNSKILHNSSCFCYVTLGEKKTQDFSALTFCPERPQKVF